MSIKTQKDGLDKSCHAKEHFDRGSSPGPHDLKSNALYYHSYRGTMPESLVGEKQNDTYNFKSPIKNFKFSKKYKIK